MECLGGYKSKSSFFNRQPECRTEFGIVVDCCSSSPRRNNIKRSSRIKFFQLDGVPPHLVQPVRQDLNENFHKNLIGRRRNIERPTRSSYLSTLDFF